MVESIPAPYVFVSYASADRDRVLPVVATLRAAGVAAWVDEASIPGGANYGAEIADAVKGAAVVLLLRSAAAWLPQALAALERLGLRATGVAAR